MRANWWEKKIVKKKSKISYFFKGRWDKQVLPDEEEMGSNWGNKRKDQVDTISFQLIAQIMACHIYKGDSQVQVRMRVMICKAFTAIHSCAFVTTSYYYCGNYSFHPLNKKQPNQQKKYKKWGFHLKLFFHWFYLFFWQWRISWWGNINLSWPGILIILRQNH